MKILHVETRKLNAWLKTLHPSTRT